MKKRLFRSTSDKMLGGVCSGIAKYLDADPAIVRLISVGCLLFGGITFWLYLVAWLIVPEES